MYAPAGGLAQVYIFRHNRGMSKQDDIRMPTVPEPMPAYAKPIAPGDSFYERLAAPLTDALSADGKGESLGERNARRLKALLGEGYTPQSAADLTFDPKLAYALALGVYSPSEVLGRFGLTEEAGRALIENPVFIATVKKYKDEITSGGISFRLKAKIQAEDLLSHSYALAVDPEVPAAVRADMIKWTAKVAGLEPDGKAAAAASGAGFSLKIVFASPEPQGNVIDITPEAGEA